MNFILATNVFGLTKVSDTLDFKDVFCVYSVNHLRLQKCITFFDILNIVVAISIMIYGELIYACKMIRPGLFFQVKSTCIFFQVVT